MTGLVDRITAVLREHRWLESEWACRCGDRHLRLAGHPAHVAERVAEALHLTEEWADADADGELDEWACGHQIIAGRRQPTVHQGYETPVRRWVSGWSAVEEKP